MVAFVVSLVLTVTLVEKIVFEILAVEEVVDVVIKVEEVVVDFIKTVFLGEVVLINVDLVRSVVKADLFTVE
jgi:hypothetical protein